MTGEREPTMLFAFLFPVLIVVLLLAMERLEARVSGPLDRAAGGAGPERAPSPDRDLRPLPSGVTALLPVPRSAPPSETRVDGVRRHADETGGHRQGAGGAIEGRVPWTYR